MIENNSPLTATALGKIIFAPLHKPALPPLPDMSLLFFDEKSTIFPWRAVCIELEIDACGSTMNEAWKNLKNEITSYIKMTKKAAGSLAAATKNIIEVISSESKQKQWYAHIYQRAKYEPIPYFMLDLRKVQWHKAHFDCLAKREL